MNEESAKKALLHKLTATDRTTIIDEVSGTFGVPHYDYNIKAIEAWKKFGMVEEVDVWFSDSLYVDISTLRLTENGESIVGFHLL